MSSSTSLLPVSADLFNIVAQGEWVLQGDNLRLTKKPELRTTSLAVADVFGKLHKNVLQAIREMECSEEFRRENFKESFYLDAKGGERNFAPTPTPSIQNWIEAPAEISAGSSKNLPKIGGVRSGERRPMIEMTRKGFEFLVLGFTGRKAAQFRESYIERFHEMEAQLVKKTNEIERLARYSEHMPYLNVSDSAGCKTIMRRIRNPDFKPLPGVSIRQDSQGEGSYSVNG